MNLAFNRRVHDDVAEILRYYDEVGGPSLGDDFFHELLVVRHNRRHPSFGLQRS